jgi:hypothetical protein
MFSRALPLIVAGFFLLQAQVHADIYSVLNIADDGPGSLRQAILDANAHPNSSASDPDRIHFAIPGTDVQMIAPQFPLPYITDPVVVDGFTQNGALPNSNPVGQGLNTTLKIELDGFALLYNGNGLTITCGNTTIRGLIISRFDSGIACRGGSGNVIAGNFIGTDRTGTFSPIIPNLGRDPRQTYGIALKDCRASRIGGRDAASRNLISGNEFGDIFITGGGATANVVEGNLMGTKASGMEALEGGSAYGVFLEDGASANLIGGTVIEARNVMSSSEATGGNFVGVAFAPAVNGLAPPFGNLVKGNFFGLNVAGTGTTNSNADPSGFGVILAGHDNVIGGTEPGARNIISGNRVGGIIVGGDTEGEEATENLIQGNFIGTDESGVLPLGNGSTGVAIRSLANNNTIGGTEPGAGNRIAFTSAGVFTQPSAGTGVGAYPGFPNSGTGNAILGNLIYGNEKLGIDLAADLVTPNDVGDADIGPNNLQNYPVLTSADFAGNTVVIRGTLDSIPNRSYRIEFFGDTSAHALAFGEGRVFLGAATVATGANGAAAFDLARPCPLGTRTVSATATDPDGNTSEFSRTLSIAGIPAGQLLNISTRLRVQTGDNVLIGGFIVTGMDPKKVLIRGIGPSLTSVSGALADPVLELFQGNTRLASNDNWTDTQRSEIEATGIPPTNDLESAIVRTLAPGAYTAVLQGRNGTTGIGLVEVYDVNQAAISELANISTRGFVDTGDNVMIGGLIIRPIGGASAKVVVRGIGPTLGNFGIGGPLQDPTLDLVNSDGVVIRSNNDWRESQQAELEALGLQPGNDRESALVQAVAPGNYTAIVRGNGSATGVALVEVYHVP